MTLLPKPGELVSSMLTAADGVLKKDVSKIAGFSKNQLLRIEKLAIDLAEMIAEGEFDDDPQGQETYLGILQDLITNFTKTLVGLNKITIEKMWNAIVKVIWNALDKATGLALPRP